MTVRNLDVAFAPRSVVVVGASPRESSVGRVVIEQILGGGFSGAVYAVNPKHTEILGLRCYSRMAELPEAPDVAVVVTPPQQVPLVIDEIGARGTRIAVVITAGIGSANGLRQQMLDAAKPHLLRIIGPNTIGLLAPYAKLNASFVHIAPIAGRLGLISQSGAMVSSIIDWAAAEAIGFSQVFSLGDMADVDVGDCLNMLAADPHTDGILMYLESIPAARKFMSAARAAARIKPVIAVKPGRHEAAAKAALTHTGSLAGADIVVDAALRRAGIIRVTDLDDLFNAAEVTARYRPLARGRVAIVTNGGGAGVLAVDELIDQRCTLATLAPETVAKLDAALPPTWSHANPVDIIGDATPRRYRQALEAVAADPGVDAILAMNCPTAVADPLAAAEGVASLVVDGRILGKPLLGCWLGKQAAGPARAALQAAGIGSFDTPKQSAAAVALLTRWSQLRTQLERVPPTRAAFAARRDMANDILARVAAEARTILTEWEAKAVLQAYGIAVPETVMAANPAEVEAVAARLLANTPAIVVKMVSKLISHKSDVGGVKLGLTSAHQARTAAEEIAASVARGFPGVSLDGFTVQPMVKRTGAIELIAGISTDPGFGPVALFGEGGTRVEIVKDTATGLLPLDDELAADLIARTRVSRLLDGYRDVKAADRGAIVGVLVAISQLVVDFPLIRAIDINPLLSDADGVIALDARIEIDPARAGVPAPNPTLAVRPYPADWTVEANSRGVEVTIRPIRPEDANLYPRFLERMDPEDMRMRFLVPMHTISHDLLVQLTQLDYDRDIAFVALERSSGDLAGIVRYSADPDRTRAEFGVLVRSDLKGHGLGETLMRRLIVYAEAEGIGELVGIVLRENVQMLTLAAELGFTPGPASGDSGSVLVRLPLRAAAPER